MDAEVLPEVHLAGMPPGNELFTQKTNGKKLAFLHVLAEGDHMPVVKQAGVGLRRRGEEARI